MTPEPPIPPTRRNRPDPAFRQRALGGPPPVPPPKVEAPSPPAPRESFRESLARIPDIEDQANGPASPEPVKKPEAPPGPVAAPAEPAARAAGSQTSTASRPPALRRAGFAVLLFALVASIPGLGYAGYQLVSQSTDGKDGASGTAPADPGYEELVISTPTALLIQNDAKGVPVNLTFLSLAGDKGGSVIFLPLDTKIPKPAFGIDRLRTAFTMTSGDHTAAAEQVAYQAASVLNVGIDDVFELDDRGWTQIVEPVAPIGFFNSDPMELNGTAVPAGDVQITADLVGPYLAVTREGEDDLSRFPRQQELLQAWLAAVAGSTRADAVPGETSTGLGLFIRTLAAGDVTYNTLPGKFTVDTTFGEQTRYEPDNAAITELIAEAVPAPDAAYPGSRATVRLLNGVAAAPIPTEITRKVVAYKGTVTVVGNGPSFGREKTTIVYANPAQRTYAQILMTALGGTGTVRLDREAPDNVDVTVVLGRDLLGDQQATTTSTIPTGGP